MPKRGENIYKRKDGRWEGRYIKYRDEQTGKPKYGSIYGSSYKAVKAELVQIKSGLKNPGDVNRAVTLHQWLELWLEDNVAPYIKPSSYTTYSHLIRNHIDPILGHCKLYRITNWQISNFIKAKAHKGRLDGTGPLSPNTVQEILHILKAAFKYAIEKKALTENPAADIKCPKPVKMQNSVFSLSDQRRLESALDSIITEDYSNHSVLFGIVVCLYTGIRIGELCALQWQDVDLVSGTISISKTIQRIKNQSDNLSKTKIIINTPKSKSSIRNIPISQGLLTKTQEYYNSLPICQKQPSSYFINQNGKYIEPRLYQKHFHRLLQKIDMPNLKFHALRHTFATRCIELNMDVKSLSQILGHSSVAITLNTYVHSFDEQQRHSMSKLDFIMTSCVS